MNACFFHSFAADPCYHEIVCLPACGTPYIATAAVVASDDSVSFPEFNVIKKFAAWYSYLANEQFIEIVGG